MDPEVNINTIHDALSRTDDVSLRTVMRRASSESWVCRETSGKGRGGKTRLYMVSMLPVDVKEALRNTDLPAVIQENLPSLAARHAVDVRRAQENTAYAKYELAKAYAARASEAGYGQKARAKRLFIDAYNLGETGSFPAVYKVVGKVDSGGKTIEGWILKLKRNGWDPMCLADKRGYAGKGKRSVSREQTQIILSIVQSPLNVPGKPIAEIIRQAMEIMGARGIPTLSESTYRRWLTQDWIPNNYDQWIWWREGDKGLNDKVLYNLTRDHNKIDAGDLLVADGHVLNFDIINPETGKPKRMMLVLFIDFKSMYPLGWEIAPTENTESISIALRRAILRLGKIPKAVYIDNGRAFKGKHFITKDNVHEIKGLYERIGVEHVIVAWAYHGQSKTVERFFGIFSELERISPSYTGTSIANKPAHMNRGEKLRRKLHAKLTNGAAISLEEAHKAIAIWFDKYADTPKGRNAQLAGYTPNELLTPGPGVDPMALRCLMMKSERRLIQSNGVTLFGEWYYSPELYGKRFYAICRYDYLNKDSVLVYNADTEEFICEAFKQSKVHPMVTLMGTEADKAEYERQIRMKHEGRKMTVASAKEIVETQVLPEARQRIEAAGFELNEGDVTGKKALTSRAGKSKAPEKLSQADKDRIMAQLDEIECDHGGDDACADYAPEVVNEAELAFARLREMSEFDRFEKLVEMEVRGWLIPKEHQAFMTYFKQSTEYERYREHFDAHRTSMALMYGSATGTEE